MNSIKETPTYWKKFSFDVFSMVKQLEVSSCIMVHSSADLKWNEIFSIIHKLHKLDMSVKDIDNLTFHDRCRLLNSNPVVVVRYFQYLVEVFFK